MAGGRPADTAVAIVTDATTPAQRVHVTALGRAEADARANGLGAPAIVAIGAIAELHATLAPFSLNLRSSA